MSPDLVTISTALSLYAAAVLSPGPNFVLVSRFAVSAGRLTALSAVLGLAVSATLYATLTMMGLALPLTRLGWLTSTVQVAGGCYLVYLGTSAWRGHDSKAPEDSCPSGSRSLAGFRAGLLVNLANPKAIAFFLSLYVVAIPIDTALWAKVAILAGGFLLEVGWYTFVTIVLSNPATRSVYTRMGPWIDRAVGTLLGGLGLNMIAEKL